MTTLMVTHNMKHAIQYGNRLIMMDAGRVVVDIRGEEKKNLTVSDLLENSILKMTVCSCLNKCVRIY